MITISLSVAFTALRDRWKAALLIALVGGMAFGLLLPGQKLAPTLPEIPAAGPELMWTEVAIAPAATQAAAIAKLLELLRGVTWVGFGIASLSVFACAGVQARERAGEIGIRRAVGASVRGTRLALLFEGLVLAAIALVAGLAVGGFLLELAGRFWPGPAAGLRAAGPLPALAISAVIAAASLTPMWLMRQRHLVEPADREVGLRVPTFQVGSSVAFLMAAAALFSTGGSGPRPVVQQAERGGAVFLVDSGSDDRAARSAGYARLLAEGAQLPGVTLLAAASPGALLGLGTVDEVTTDCGMCNFGNIIIRWPHFPALAQAVSPDSFAAQGLHVVEGRTLEPGDGPRAKRVAVVNQNLATHYFQGGQAVGRDIYLGPGWPKTPYRVVGIVADERTRALGGSLQPRETVYLSVLQHPTRMVEVLVRGGNGTAVREALRRALGAGAQISEPVDEARVALVQERAVRWFGAGFGVVALLVLLMAMAGTAFAMRAWSEAVLWELSLRRAVGARRRAIIAIVVLRVGGVAVGGALLGLFLYATVLAGSLAEAAAGLPLADAERLFGVAVAPVLLALLAGIIPALGVVRRPPGAVLH